MANLAIAGAVTALILACYLAAKLTSACIVLEEIRDAVAPEPEPRRDDMVEIFTPDDFAELERILDGQAER
jgi:hypothetical protein